MGFVSCRTCLFLGPCIKAGEVESPDEEYCSGWKSAGKGEDWLQPIGDNWCPWPLHTCENGLVGAVPIMPTDGTVILTFQNAAIKQIFITTREEDDRLLDMTVVGRRAGEDFFWSDAVWKLRPDARWIAVLPIAMNMQAMCDQFSFHDSGRPTIS